MHQIRLAIAAVWTLLPMTLVSCSPNLGDRVAILESIVPEQLAFADHRVWFANGLVSDNPAHIVGSVNASLTVTKFSLPGDKDGFDFSHGIASDGNVVWFNVWRGSSVNDKFQNSVGALDVTSGSIHTLPIPTDDSEPGDMAAYLGRVVLAEANANAIGEVIKSRVVEHRLPGGVIRDHNGPVSITIAADGRVYFIVGRSHKIGTFGRGGQWHVLETPVGSQPEAITSSGDTVWFIDSAGSQIGSFQTSQREPRITMRRIPWKGSRIGSSIDARGSIVCFTLSEPAIGCLSKRGVFRRLSLPGSNWATNVLLDGARIWFSLGHISNYDVWFGAVGWLPLSEGDSN